MKLYDTLSRQIKEVTPQAPPKTTVYTCGPTVYDYPHIGNWFTFLRYDLLVRALKTAGLEPEWVMNITDVGHLVSDADEGEDKLQKGARRENKTAWDVAEFYGQNFIGGLRKLNILPPAALPKATGHIKEQIRLIEQLETKGLTYLTSDGVYFDTAKLPDYGKLARLDKEHLKAGARVEYNEQKKNPTDFALWKFSPAGEQRDMEWLSPWGTGFPGWHIECSAMGMKYLGETLDIHAGGIDHIPVHHTNEIAQSEAATGRPFANLWLHANHILVNGQKISKSLGNGITLEDIEKIGYDPLDLRLLVLESHYRSQAHFTWDSLLGARKRRESLQAMADLRFQATDRAMLLSDKYLSIQANAVTGSLQEDLNTPVALRVLSETSTLFETNGLPLNEQAAFETFLGTLDTALGLDLLGSAPLDETASQLISQRAAAREAKDWALSDRLRDELAAAGLAVRDLPAGTIWFRTFPGPGNF